MRSLMVRCLEVGSLKTRFLVARSLMMDGGGMDELRSLVLRSDMPVLVARHLFVSGLAVRFFLGYANIARVGNLMFRLFMLLALD